MPPQFRQKIGVTGVDSSFATAIRTTVILIFTWIGRFIYPIVLVLQHHLIPDMALSDIVRSGDRSFLALLFSRVATGRSVTRCAHGQTKCPFRNSLRGHCSLRNGNVASLAWRRTCADGCRNPGFQIKRAAGFESGESNRHFSSLRFGMPCYENFFARKDSREDLLNVGSMRGQSRCERRKPL